MGVYYLPRLTTPRGSIYAHVALMNIDTFVVIFRHCSLSFVVSVTVLACTDDLLERSQMLKQWIMIAKELLRTQGNLFSFGAIMHGLCSSSVSFSFLYSLLFIKYILNKPVKGNTLSKSHSQLFAFYWLTFKKLLI